MAVQTWLKSVLFLPHLSLARVVLGTYDALPVGRASALSLEPKRVATVVNQLWTAPFT